MEQGMGVEGIAVAAPTWAQGECQSGLDQNSYELQWRTVDRALRSLAVQRAGLEADELRWLREAEALQITGTATHVEVRRSAEPAAEPAAAHLGVPTKLERAVLPAEAKAALTQMGWKPAIASAAVADAVSALGEASFEQLITAALRRCPIRARAG